MYIINTLLYIHVSENQDFFVRIGGVRDGVVNGTRTRWDNDRDPLYWLNGVKVPTSGPDNHWHSGLPDNSNQNEGCMELSGGWNDINCDIDKYFICEKLPN